ncbi:MAG: 5-formyltetrahydrofolate cyclo-ligase [Desulfobacterales bacterium]|nr:5-formyltetrahydrofolate cyclo-ligase [Desulfobacterales bacterium]
MEQGQAMGMGRPELRKRVLTIRDRLPVTERATKSGQIHNRLWQLPAFANAELLCIYVSFRSEVETMGLIRQSLAFGKTVTVPLTVIDPPQLIPYKIDDPDQDLVCGYCGIPEPDPGRTGPVDPGGIEAVLVPGAVFDPLGGRLGYGGGYYDRFLALKAPQAVRIGIAFAAQLVDRVPVLAHDQPLDYLVTEERVLSTRARQGG